MWGKLTLFHRAKSTEKIFKKYNYCHNQLRKAF